MKKTIRATRARQAAIINNFKGRLNGLLLSLNEVKKKSSHAWYGSVVCISDW